MERVLVVFQATGAKTEGLALAFGLGAVEGGANIRLRHLESATPTALEHQGYGRIKVSDIEWAEVIGLALEAPEPADELLAFLEQVKIYRDTAPASEKSAYIFGSATQTPSMNLAEEMLSKLGFSLIHAELPSIGDDPQHEREMGKHVASVVHSPESS